MSYLQYLINIVIIIVLVRSHDRLIPNKYVIKDDISVSISIDDPSIIDKICIIQPISTQRDSLIIPNIICTINNNPVIEDDFNTNIDNNTRPILIIIGITTKSYFYPNQNKTYKIYT